MNGEEHLLRFRPARAADLPALRVLYNGIIEAMDASPWHAQWRKDGYPTDADLAAATAAGELHVAVRGCKIVAALVLNNRCNPGYQEVAWGVDCAAEQVLCIHTLGVDPACQRQGVAAAMVQYAVGLARERGCQCLRLDVIDTNRPADLFYTRQGFALRGQRRLVYDSVCAEFRLYELVL